MKVIQYGRSAPSDYCGLFLCVFPPMPIDSLLSDSQPLLLFDMTSQTLPSLFSPFSPSSLRLAFPPKVKGCLGFLEIVIEADKVLGRRLRCPFCRC